jgi:hypothetical protein
VLADLTAVDWFPSEPRFEVVYSLLSHERHERIRVKVKVSGADPYIESVTGSGRGHHPSSARSSTSSASASRDIPIFAAS